MTELIRMFPLFIALCSIAAGILVQRGGRGGIRNPVQTNAVVVSKITQTGYRHHSAVEMSAPVVRYETEHGEVTAAYRKFLPEWQDTYRIGEEIPICYDRENPTQFRICRNQTNRMGGALLILSGCGTLLAYAVLLLQYY